MIDKLPFISICIPAFKRTEYLKRLLNSIVVQEYRDFEVVVSDDSPDNAVRDLCISYQSSFRIVYQKNSYAYGTPENWNAATRLASGKWIKLMHDDDWFLSEKALSIFADHAINNQDHFLFCAYQNHFLDKNTIVDVFPSRSRLQKLKKEPAVLFAKNIIGPPSVTMYRKSNSTFYDNKFKWVVDIDFYINQLKNQEFHFISETLIAVGMSEEQVTASCFRNPEIEIPENFGLLLKLNIAVLKNVLVYDAFWRLLRNLNVRSVKQIRQHGFQDSLPGSVLSMISFQNKIPYSFLKIGFFSKIFMILHYLFHSPQNKKQKCFP